MECNERKDLQQRKEIEIINLLKTANHSEKVLTELKNCNAIVISAPTEEVSMSVSLMTFDHRGNSYSIKPGNVLLNISKLIFAVPAATTAAASIIENNLVLKVCAFLLIWKELRACFAIDITSDEANVMIALWRACNNNHEIGVSEGLIATKQYLKSKHEDELSEYKYQKVLDNLIEIGSVEVIDDVIWLREWISKGYR